MNPFSLRDDEPVRLHHFCVCRACGLVFGPFRFYPSSDGIARQPNCFHCDPYPGIDPIPAASNAGDFLCAGLRALSRPLFPPSEGEK